MNELQNCPTPQIFFSPIWCSLTKVRRHFKSELLNGLNEIVIFDPLSHNQLRKVARLRMKDVASRLAERGIALTVEASTLDYILAESYDPVYGARPIRRLLEKKVVTKLSRMLVMEEIDVNSTVYMDAPNGSESDAAQAVKEMKIEEIGDEDDQMDS
ncbi:hypothetical protein GOBAR_DD15486 [Gossypium barbadense]|nr:hypothetical protein GOBAR_DD15486 [Gossypium barbadense]